MRKKVYTICLDGVMCDEDFATLTIAKQKAEESIADGICEVCEVYVYDYGTQEYECLSHFEIN